MLVMLTGSLESLDTRAGSLWLGLGSAGSKLVLELHIPASTAQQLSTVAVGGTVTVHTHLEFAPQGPVGALRPRLYGFAHPLDRQFFLRLITVKGVGASVALDMLAAPTASIAAAIQTGDEAFLKKLPRIGASKARLLIAELRGKVAAFEGTSVTAVGSAKVATLPGDAVSQQVLAILTAQLDLDGREAEALLDKARGAHPEATDLESLLTAVFAVR